MVNARLCQRARQAIFFETFVFFFFNYETEIESQSVLYASARPSDVSYENKQANQELDFLKIAHFRYIQIQLDSEA